MRFIRYLLFTSIFCLISSSFAFSFLLKDLSFKQMAALADSIFLGTLVDVDNHVEMNGKKVRRYTFQILECHRGNCQDDTLSFNQLVVVNDAVPQFETGKTYSVFLARPSKNGLTNPVGLFQGRALAQYKNKRWVLPLNAQNKNFLGKLQKVQQELPSGHGAVSRSISSGDDIDYSIFKSILTDHVGESSNK